MTEALSRSLIHVVDVSKVCAAEEVCFLDSHDHLSSSDELPDDELLQLVNVSVHVGKCAVD